MGGGSGSDQEPIIAHNSIVNLHNCRKWNGKIPFTLNLFLLQAIGVKRCWAIYNVGGAPIKTAPFIF